MTTTAVAFDMFGTLADPAGAAEALGAVTDEPEALAGAWRRHQLEISWLLTVMDRYQDWSAVSAYALEVALDERGLAMTGDQQDRVLGAAPVLFPDVADALDRLAAAGFELAVFSNGAPAALAAIVADTGIAHRFTTLISVDEVGAFKPAPSVYHHAAARLGRAPGDVWLVSGNPFDCAGAKAAGLRVAKVDRRPSFSYPFAPPPDLVVTGLGALAAQLPAA
ncbi:MAG TPA: haloacid dehalogenase type II [Acidimicrobiales bacterium]|nr:haloacid dehalogenase type II [Acidimicrobiales bacterium]